MSAIPKWFKFIFLCQGLQTVIAQRPQASQIQSSIESLRAPALPSGEYVKARTQFDGVSEQKSVTYLKVPYDSISYFPLSSQNQLNINLDATVQFWFKLNWTPNGNDQLHLFSIKDSVLCYVDSQLDFTCQASINQRMVAPSTNLRINKWFYFTLSVSKEGVAYMIVQDNTQVVASGFAENFYFQQSSLSGWNACFGGCIEGLIHNAEIGVREFAAFGQFIQPEATVKNRNSEFLYVSKTWAYFRIKGYQNDALVDQFTDKPLIQSTTRQLSKMIGEDFIASDVCPSTFERRRFYVFDGQQAIAPQKLKVKLNQTSYAYTSEVTLRVDPSSCFTNSVQKARSSCNIVLLDGVFMIYFAQKNMARVHFFAYKSYYESQSNLFFVPFNSWVRIQLSLSQFGGWQVVLTDLQSNTISQSSQTYNMQLQFPSASLSLFTGMAGAASAFSLYGAQMQLPITDRSKTPLVRLDFKLAQNVSVQNTIADRGINKGTFNFTGIPKVASLRFQNNAQGSQVKFDGVACEDGHRALLLNSNTSTVLLQTPQLSGQTSLENTFEFWFRPSDLSYQNSSNGSQIFQLYDTSKNFKYWQVLIDKQGLQIVPFSGRPDQSIVFAEFSQANQDQFGWWHLACSQSQNGQGASLYKCTLYNEVVEATYSLSLVGDTQVPLLNRTLDVSFGYSYVRDSPLGVAGASVKHYRLWNLTRSTEEIQENRRRQLDPRTAEGLLMSMRFDAENLFEDTAYDILFPGTLKQVYMQKTMNIDLVRDYQVSRDTLYNETSQQVDFLDVYQYHAVCPYYTYPFASYCYSDPVNQAVLSVFPSLSSNKLTWLFTLEHSSLIDKSLMNELDMIWESENSFVSSLFEKDQSVATEKRVQASYLHQESTYLIEAGFTNYQGTIRNLKQIRFVPNQCRWFEVYGSDAFSGRLELNLVQGVNDISFQLQLKQNPSVNCASFNFYNQFNGVEFEFLTSNSILKIENQPKTVVQVLALSDIASIQPTTDYTARNLLLNVTIPSSEQEKLPLWTDIKILMDIKWKSSLQDFSPDSGILFQNVLYTVKFAPDNNELSVAIDQNKEFVTRNQTIVLDASSTSISNFPPQLIGKSLTFKWICPIELQTLCLNQTSPILAISWGKITQTPLNYAQTYTFQVQAKWKSPSGKVLTKTESADVIWYDTTLPNFNISYSPTPILQSNSQNSRFRLIPINFYQADFIDFNIVWKITPELGDSDAVTFTNENQTMEVTAGSWTQLTNYTVSAQLIYKDQPNISSYQSVKLSIFGPPFNGSVVMTPMTAQVGDTYTIDVANWVSLTKTSIFYSVYMTMDSQGITRGAQLNSKPIENGKSFTSQFKSVNPIQVVIQDLTGEQKQVILTPSVEPLPSPSDNSTSNSSDTSTQPENFAKTTAPKGRKLEDSFSQLLQSLKSNQDPDAEVQLLKTVQDYDISILGQNWAIQALEVFDLVSSSKISTGYLKALPILEKISKLINQQNDTVVTLNEVTKRLQLLVQIPMSYDGETISIQSRNINCGQDQAANQLNLTVLDATYLLDPLAICQAHNSLLPQNYYAQGWTLKGVNDRPITSLNIVQSESLTVTGFSDFNGRLVVVFSINPSDYTPGQTVCQTNLAETEQWSSDTCLAEVLVQTEQLKCTCNVIGATQIRIFDDSTQPIGGVVQFPSVLLSQRKFDAQIKGFSYFLIALIATSSLFSLVGSALLWRKDAADQRVEQERCLTAFQTDVITAVSKKLNQPTQIVKLRSRAIFEYYFSGYSPFRHIFFGIHPLFQAFTAYSADQSRFLRFSAYLMQINMYIIGCILNFGTMYRRNDDLRQQQFLDGLDIAGVNLVACSGCIVLLPIVSEPFIRFLQDKITFQEGKEAATTTKQRVWLRVIFTMLCLALNLTTILVAVHQCLNTPASNQYLMAISLVSGFIGATFFSNVTRVVICCYLKHKFQLFTSPKSRQILTDIQAVLDAQKQIRAETEAKTTQETLKDHETSQESVGELDKIQPFELDKVNSTTEIQQNDLPTTLRRLSFMTRPRTAFTAQKPHLENEK